MSVTRPIYCDASVAGRAVAAWRQGCFDTHMIAKRLGVPEHEVCRAVAADQDARNRARIASAGVGR